MQKPLSFLLILLVTSSHFSCKNNSNSELKAYKILEESIANSNQTISQENITRLMSLYEKMADPSTVYKASFWYPKALQAQKLSDEVYKYIEKIKTDFRIDAEINNKNEVGKNDKRMIQEFFKRDGKGSELYKRLHAFKDNLLLLDENFRKLFDKSILPALSNSGAENFTQIYFNDVPPIGAIAILTSLQSNIRSAENKIIEFCYLQIGSFVDSYKTFSVIIGQNSTYIRTGEKIEINAGVGVFSSEARPDISINGILIPVNENGVAVYNRTMKKPGKYKVPVKIEYLDQEGKSKTIENHVEFVVSNQNK